MDIFPDPKDSVLKTLLPKDLKELRTWWQCGEVIFRTQQQREGKEVPCQQKDLFPTFNKEAFTLSSSFHNLGQYKYFFSLCAASFVSKISM